MSAQILINGQNGQKTYIGWTPQSCQLIFQDNQTASKNIQLRCVSVPSGGLVQFSIAPNQKPQSTLNLTRVDTNLTVDFFIAGSRASTEDQDTRIEAVDAQSGALIISKTVMVRVRKNANKLTNNERNRFIKAFVSFNRSTSSPNYQDFLDRHNDASHSEIHSTRFGGVRLSFLPWHRAFLLDLERRLQMIDPTVTIPYWKFDEGAGNVFTADFMGEATMSGSLNFSDTNDFRYWTIKGRTGIIRKPNSDIRVSPPSIPDVGPIRDEANTLAYGDLFSQFFRMENNPHGYAHGSFQDPAPINDPTTAPEDPLFFLLHANVDRLWALWQKKYGRYNSSDAATYTVQGAFTPGGQFRVGDFVKDTMWPWNGDTQGSGSTRPPTAPGGPFPQLTIAAVPSQQPTVEEIIDYQGYLGVPCHHSDYDDIPYQIEHPTEAIRVMNERLIAATDKSFRVNEEVAANLKKTSAMSDLNTILDQRAFLDPSDNDAAKRLLQILGDQKENTNIRQKALKKLFEFLFQNEEAVQLLIQISSNEQEPVALRRAALQSLLTVRFTSTALAALLPEFRSMLRGLVDSSDPELSQLSIKALATYKDTEVQKLLIEGLEDTRKAKVPDEIAVQLLGNDIHNNFYPVIRKVLQQTTDKNVQREAVVALSGDPESEPIIAQLVGDKDVDSEVRLACLAAVSNFKTYPATEVLKSLATDPTEDHRFRISSLNLLSNLSDVSTLQSDSDFQKALINMVETDSDDLRKASLHFISGQRKESGE